MKEKYTRYNFLTVISSFTGVLFILRPTIIFGDKDKAESNISPKNRLNGIFWGIFASFMDSIVYLILRKIKSASHPAETVQYFATGICLMSPIGMINQKQTFPGIKQILSLVPLGIVGYTGQMMKSRALQIDKAAKLAVINYTQIIFTTIYDYLIFGIHLSKFSLLGIGLILSSSIIISLKPQ